MRLETKAQIARTTLLLLTSVSAVFLLGVLVLVLCVGLQINPFKETTSELLGAAFAGLIGVAAVLVLLNVATNVSLIADAKIAELKLETRSGQLKKWGFAFVAAATALVILVFSGTYFSKERYMGIVRSQANEVLQSNGTLLDEISHLLASGKVDDYKRINDIRGFLQNQRADLPQLTVIYAGQFGGKLAFFRVPEYFPVSRTEETFTPTYFACTKSVDCDYLTKFFSGEKSDVLQKYMIRNDEFYIYIPFTGKEARYVMLFDRRNRYGKLGS